MQNKYTNWSSWPEYSNFKYSAHIPKHFELCFWLGPVICENDYIYIVQSKSLYILVAHIEILGKVFISLQYIACNC